VLRSIAELAAYGTFAALLAAASLTPTQGDTASSAMITSEVATDNIPAIQRSLSATAERGALLFAVKGCIGCHMHAAFPSAQMQVGPDLTRLADRAGSTVAGLGATEYVRQSLREPGAYRASSSYAVMPNLGLSDEQVETLTAFLLFSVR
jgi:cytochrome c551/c552